MTNPLPDLSKWHEVPAAADIPADEVHAWLHRSDWGVQSTTDPLTPAMRTYGTRYFTADPIPAPQPAPPTEPRVSQEQLERVADELWDQMVGAAKSSVREAMRDAFEAAGIRTSAPRTPDPLDETDHRPRMCGGRPLTLRDCGRWHLATVNGANKCAAPFGCGGKYTLAGWAADGYAVTFADEVTA